LPGSIRTVKLGHPVPLLNLVIEANSGSPGHGVDVDAGLVVIPVLVPERRFGGALLGDPVLLGREPRDCLRILAVVVRHVSSFAAGAARWMRVCAVHSSTPQRPLLFRSVYPGQSHAKPA
jgi:hypothetical protein